MALEIEPDMNRTSNSARATFFADAVILWITLSPTLLLLKSTAAPRSIVAAIYLAAIAYAAARLYCSPLKAVLANTFRQDKLYWIWAAFLAAAAFVSATYSTAALTTLRHACLLSGTVFIGLYLGCQYSGSTLLKLLVFALVPAAIVSVFLCATEPGSAVMHSPAYHQLHDLSLIHI